MKTRTVSWSELDAIRQCRFKHRLGYLERWQSPETGPALSRGKLFHSVMEEHYKFIQALQRGEGERLMCIVCGALADPDLGKVLGWCGDPEDGIQHSAREQFILPQEQARKDRIVYLLHQEHDGSQTPEQELVHWMYDGYVGHYGADNDWKVLAVEHEVREWLPTSSGGRSRFLLKGKIDLIVRDLSSGGGKWIVDHKTCRNLPKGRETDFDDQFAIYEWLLRQRGNDIRGIIYNAVRTEKLVSRVMDASERFKRILTIRGAEELDVIADEAYRHFLEAYHGVQVGDDGEPPVALPLPPPRTPNPDLCRWRCSFTEPCLASRKGRNVGELLAETGYEQNFERH